MDTLCRLLEQEPEKLLDLRNIGPKGMAVIRKVCACYDRETGGSPAYVYEETSGTGSRQTQQHSYRT